MQYTYECQKCKHEQDKQHKLNDKNEEPCEKCQAPAEELKRVISLTAGRHSTWGKWHAQ